MCGGWACALSCGVPSRVPVLWQKLDLERETIELVHTEPTDVAQLPSRVPREAARYHFFLYKHTHEGDPLESVGEWLQQGPHAHPWLGRSRLASVVGQQWGGEQVPRPASLTAPSPPVFIYSMPGYKCSIKERMLYSSCKSRLLDSVEQDFQLVISKKVGAPSPGPSPLHWGIGVLRHWQSRGRCCRWIDGETETQG